MILIHLLLHPLPHKAIPNTPNLSSKSPLDLFSQVQRKQRKTRPHYVLPAEIKSKEEGLGRTPRKPQLSTKSTPKTMKTPPVVRARFSQERIFILHSVVEQPCPFDKLTGGFSLSWRTGALTMRIIMQPLEVPAACACVQSYFHP